MRQVPRSVRRERMPRLARRRNKACPGLEVLESRVVLYSASGNAWPNPGLITISFMPDGTNLGGGVSSNLESSFNSKSSLSGWENVILQAAQVWAEQTNINFAVVPDDGAAVGSAPTSRAIPDSATSASAATTSVRPRWPSLISRRRPITFRLPAP